MQKDTFVVIRLINSLCNRIVKNRIINLKKRIGNIIVQIVISLKLKYIN